MREKSTARLMLTAAAMMLGGCSNAYYGAMEMLGTHKREILVDRVEDARDDQQQAKQQFRDALEQFSALIDYDGGELEAKYERLRDELEASEDAAEDVRGRIRSVENVGEALFAEWEKELDEYTSDEFRRSSERTLRTTRRQYDRMVEAMRRAAAKMDPVLNAFRDHVLFLKHNLNARAVASLEDVGRTLRTNVQRLIEDMEASISEANRFIEQMSEGESDA